MYKVLVADSIAEEGLEAFKEYSDLQIDVNTGLTPEQLGEIIGEYDGLVVRSASNFRGEVIPKATKMKVVGRAGAGVDNIDVEECSKKGVIVMNTPGGNSEAAAELAVSMIMTLSRNIVPASISMKNGKWEKKALAKTSVEVLDKTLGVIGAGNIGGIVATRALGLKMNVLVFDPFLTEEKAKMMGITKVETLEEIYSQADYITLHLPKNEKTLNLINKDSIAKMKDNVYIINCARGGIINEADLLDALNSGKVKGAGLDVFDKEPVDPDNPLVHHPNVICTPHLGASTVEAQINVAVAIAHQIGNYLSNNVIKNALNAPSYDNKTNDMLKPYLSLTNKIGLFYSQFGNLCINELEISMAGEVCNLPSNPITNSLLIGLFTRDIGDINFVNAGIMAQEKGIKVVETKSTEQIDYSSLITIRAKHSDGETVIKGAVFQENIIRIVGIDNFNIDFVPQGNLLLTINNDVPGFIGDIGTILGKENINIANMELGRSNKEALSLIEIDGDISDSILKKISSSVSSLKSISKIEMN